MCQIEKLSDKLNKESLGLVRSDFDIYKYETDLRQLDVRELCSCQFRYSEHYTYKFLFMFPFIWVDLSLQDWKTIIMDHVENELSLVNIFVFLQRYLKIDSVELLNSLDRMPKRMRRFLKRDFKKRPGIMRFTIMDEINLEGLNLDYPEVSNRLISELKG